MTQIFGNFIERSHDVEFLIINFSPSSIPLQERWRSNGLSADFLGDYWAVFFPADDTAGPNKRDEVKGAVSYIANELLENAMKFSYSPSRFPISIALHLYGDNKMRFYVSNSIDPQNVAEFQSFIQQLLIADPDELYIEQVEKSAEDDLEHSQLGLLTMINDYGASLAWKFETIPQEHGQQFTVVTTMVQLTI